MAADFDSDELRRVYQHVFLPPNLPQSAGKGEEIAELDAMLLASTRSALEKFPGPVTAAVSNAIEAIKNLQIASKNSVTDLCQALNTLADGHTVPVHVRSQNAGVLITRKNDDLIFESFELSPTNSAVLAAKGRLTRCFPAIAVAVDNKIHSHHDLTPVIARTLHTMSNEVTPEMQPESRKAGEQHKEYRDTASPAIVTEMLFGCLRGLGKTVSVSSVSKQTRDEVFWEDALAPWRRSPLWLHIRVTLHLLITRAPDGSNHVYKSVMAFLMSQLLDAATSLHFPSEILYAMSAKIVRRMHKLRVSTISGDEGLYTEIVFTDINAVLQTASAIIARRWQVAQDNDSRTLDLGVLARLDFEHDTRIALPALDAHISFLRSRTSKSTTFEFQPASSLLKCTHTALPCLPDRNSPEYHYATANLQSVETWIADNIDDWVKGQTSSCGILRTYMEKYYELACDHYGNNPEGVSVMILTMFELWIACDKLAVKECPLLAEYPPNIPLEPFQNLLLPFLRQMTRLQNLEDYLKKRSQQARSDLSSTLFSTTSPRAFAVRFFEDSPAHQHLRDRIEKEARAAKLAKQAEYTSTRREYDRLDGLHSQAADCDKVMIVVDAYCNPPETKQVHSNSCRRCSYLKQRDALRITVHEWPLPADHIRSAAVVFELQVPTWYAAWRDARAFLLHKVLKGDRPEPQLRATYVLDSNDPHLTRKFYQASPTRVGLLSEDKPMVVSHYGIKKIPDVDTQSVCVSNALKYEYYDKTAACYMTSFTFKHEVQKSCTYVLSTPSLQQYIFRPASSPDGEPPNAVIASQDECPDHMSLDEYKELMTIPLGHHLQWVHILQQLAMPGVDFRKIDTTLTFMQCINQAGPPSEQTLRESHAFCHDHSSAIDVLANLDIAVERVKQNWESCQAMSLFVYIATRVLSLNDTTLEACLPLLAKMRSIAFDWLRTLQEAAHIATDDSDRLMFISRSVEIAYICGTTYDVPEEHFPALLSSTDVCSTLLQVSIVAQHGKDSQKSAPIHIQMLRMRFTRLLHRCYKFLAVQLESLDNAVKQSWSVYVPGDDGWEAVSDIVDEWVTTKTVIGGGSPMDVHYNIISGELLVNGVPLDQPPQQYRSMDLFRTLFGNSVVEVMPSLTPGFQFSTKRTFGDNAVLMGLQDHRLNANTDLVVRASRADVVVETLPRSVFGDNFPEDFLHKYVHWYNLKSCQVEFRPIERPWDPHPATVWTLQRSQKSTWQLVKDSNIVVGLRSPTARALSSVLQPLADLSQTYCIMQGQDRSLKIELPKLDLSFSVSKGASLLKSKEYPSMSVDRDQALGTLIGLSNKLMLVSGSGERLLLLPEADVVCTQQQMHVSVRISSLRTVQKVHALRVDSQLDRLVDQGDLGCKFYLAYLHALTSSCWPDPLTHTTGTEQALRILGSCAARSFDQLTQANIDMLACIARLSPGRRYYPAHERVMQTVLWNGQLSFLSQHARLRLSVQAIYDQAQEAATFHPDNKLEFPRLKECATELQQRDSIRSSTFRVAEYGAEDHTLEHDSIYVSRDRGINSSRSERAALISGLMARQNADKHWEFPTLDQLWQKLVRCSTVYGPDRDLGDTYHPYDSACLKEEHFAGVLARLPAHIRKLGQTQQRQQDRHSMIVWLATLAFCDDADMEVIQLLAMSSKYSALSAVRAPPVDVFHMDDGIVRLESDIRNIIYQSSRAFDFCPEAQTARYRYEKGWQYDARCQNLWLTARESVVQDVSAALVGQFPASEPSPINIRRASLYIDVGVMMAAVQKKFRSWHNNNLLYNYAVNLVRSVKGLPTNSVWLPTLANVTASARASGPGYFTVEDIFSGLAPHVPKSHSIPQISSANEVARGRSDEPHQPRLPALLDQLAQSAQSSGYEMSYADDLQKSFRALLTHVRHSVTGSLPTRDDLVQHQGLCRSHVHHVYGQLQQAIKCLEHSEAEQTMHHWPRTSPSLLLQHLAHNRVACLPQCWRVSIVNYGVAITALQQADRLVALANDPQSLELLNELRNPGHTNWTPHEYPESLLMEVESGIMIREVQEDIASEMRNPSSDSNAVMQLNMGEGKSTVIIPMVAASLANANQLVRVVVAKPQSKQMAQMLIAKFGGLVARRIYYMPFSRSLSLTPAAANQIDRTLKQCMSTGGILLVQPEHLLSFKLMAPECYMSSNTLLGQQLMETQDFFDKYSRDIVDESDENFSVRFELIYTMGTQQSIELSPDRWFLTQQVLEIVQRLIPGISTLLPSSVEISSNDAGGFPRIRLLKPDATNLLIHWVATHVRDNGLEGFQISRQTQGMREAIFTYITHVDLPNDLVQFVEQGEFWDTCKQSILLLRGILAGGVLAFAFSQKRWRVNYGLTVRTPPTKLTVPYRAKDNPSPRSEFSHPDVVIMLTSLCYYYGGISDDDMFTALSHLAESDQRDAEYQTWIKYLPDLPVAFRQLQGINLKDRLQCITLLFPHLRRGKAVVDYFLSHIVFPKEMKEFPHKLSASGWDLGKKKQLVTTGFSGTNDSRRLLPLFVNQLDLEEQTHTNALVLEYLLQPINRIELMSSISGGEENLSDAEHLISTSIRLDPPVQVILDVGAQILELDNLGVAKAWLKKSDLKVEAVVFVDDADELCVIDRKDRVDYLRISPFAARLDVCLVFLDESHTRGIDLKLPVHYRALVTLGANLSKDRLVQACMRMRKLGKGQSVTFCVSPEIQTKIRENRSNDTGSAITVEDVLLWSISETHAETRRSMPLWSVQGERFVRNEKVWESMKKDGATILSQTGAEDLLEQECQSLDDRYRPRKAESHPTRLANADDPDLRRIADRCHEFDGLQFNSSSLQEEQERELSPEVERERQVQRARPAEPASHSLHPHVKQFALTGKLNNGFDAYLPAFQSLMNTTAAGIFELEELTADKKLLVTTDFAKTIKPNSNSFQSDAFQRHVHWLLTASNADVVDCIMIVSEYEANLLLPVMKSASSATALHKYKARSNAAYAPLDQLDLFTVSGTSIRPMVPRSLSIQLALFAGQLYVSSYEDYLEVCRFLGLSPKLLTKEMEDDGWKVGKDGFILKDGSGNIGGTSGLSKSPMPFLKVLMSKIRRNGDSISKTDIGRLLDSMTFQESYWDDLREK